MTKQQRIAFAAVIVVAALLRFVQLGSIPYGINQDEAERGYEAYSLLQTGHDMHGNPWPLTLEAYSALHDNASAISAYAAIPFTALLGPGVYAVRIPSAIAGLITVCAVMLLARRVSKQWNIAMIAGAVLAVSPWHLTISRTGHEAVWLPTLFVLGALAFWIALEQRPWFLSLAVLAWGIGFYGYGPGKVFFPLVALLAFASTARHIRWRHPGTWVAIFLAFGLAVPILGLSSGQLGLGRFQEVSIFSHGFGRGLKSLAISVLTYVNPVSWLQARVTAGPLDWVAILIGVPFYFILGRSIGFRWSRVIAASLLIFAVLPAALTSGNPNQLRAVGLLGILPILGAWGFASILQPLRDHFRSDYWRPLAYSMTAACAIVGIALFWQPSYAMRTGYARAAPAYTPEIQKLFTYLSRAPDTEVWIVDDTLNQPQIFFMLLQPWPSPALREDHVYEVNGDGWYWTSRLGRFHFCKRATCSTHSAGSVFVEVTTGDHIGTRELARFPIQGFPATVSLAWVVSRNE